MKKIVSEIMTYANNNELRSNYRFDRWSIDLKPYHLRLAKSFIEYSKVNRTDVLDFYKSDASDTDKFILGMIWGGIRKSNLNLLIGAKELSGSVFKINNQISKSLSDDFINVYFTNDSSIHIPAI